MKSLILLSLLAGVCWANEEIEPAVRFLATTTTSCVTSTSTVVATSTTTSTSTRVCATTSNITSPSLCRRRRGVEEQPLILAFDEEVQDFAPSVLESVESSVAATLPEQAAAEAAVEALPASAELSSSQGEDLVAVDIQGMDAACKQERFFFGATVSPILTVVFKTVCASTSVTATTVVTASATTTKAYTLVGCIPSALTASLC